jgi:hypothetical protein
MPIDTDVVCLYTVHTFAGALESSALTSEVEEDFETDELELEDVEMYTKNTIMPRVTETMNVCNTAFMDFRFLLRLISISESTSMALADRWFIEPYEVSMTSMSLWEDIASTSSTE